MSIREGETGRYSDREILDAWRASDQAALDLLYRRYARQLRRFCRSRLADPAEAEDACHESILKAHRALSRFDEGRRMWPWLATIAAHVCIDIQRNRQRVIVREAVEKADYDLENVVDRRLRANLLGLALVSIPLSYRTHIYLRDLRGWSYEAMAQSLQVSVASVRSTLMRARRSLKVAIREVADKQGQWPLPAFLLIAYSRIRAALSRIANAVRVDSGPGSPRMAWVDPGFWEGLSHAVAAIAIFALVISSPAVNGPGRYESTPRSRTAAQAVPLALSGPTQYPRASVEVSAGLPPQTAPNVIETSSRSAEVDVDGDEEPDAGIEVGPVGISCDPEAARGPVARIVSDAACLVIGKAGSH